MRLFQGIKPLLFALLTEKENIKFPAVLKSCDTAKHVSTDKQFLKIKLQNSVVLEIASIYVQKFYWFLSIKILLAVFLIAF